MYKVVVCYAAGMIDVGMAYKTHEFTQLLPSYYTNYWGKVDYD